MSFQRAARAACQGRRSPPGRLAAAEDGEVEAAGVCRVNAGRSVIGPTGARAWEAERPVFQPLLLRSTCVTLGKSPSVPQFPCRCNGDNEGSSLAGELTAPADTGPEARSSAPGRRPPGRGCGDSPLKAALLGGCGNEVAPGPAAICRLQLLLGGPEAAVLPAVGPGITPHRRLKTRWAGFAAAPGEQIAHIVWIHRLPSFHRTEGTFMRHGLRSTPFLLCCPCSGDHGNEGSWGRLNYITVALTRSPRQPQATSPRQPVHSAFAVTT